MTLPAETALASAASHAQTNTGLLVIIIPLIGVVLGFLLRNRKLTMDYNSGLRSEFISEMKELRDEVKSSRDEVHGLRGENEALRGEVKIMRRENDLLRDEVRSLHGVIDGLRRSSLQASLSAQRDLLKTFPDGTIPTSSQDAMDALDRSPAATIAMQELHDASMRAQKVSGKVSIVQSKEGADDDSAK